MSDQTTKPLASMWQGAFRLFGVDVRCHVLSDGSRIIEEDSMAALLDAMGDPGKKINQAELEAFAGWRAGKKPP